jgi:hypothetical protein
MTFFAMQTLAATWLGLMPKPDVRPVGPNPKVAASQRFERRLCETKNECAEQRVLV